MNEKKLSNERGQSLVLVAAALVALVIFVAITVDMSSAYYNRRTAQNAADGAALAGVSVMATGINKNNPKLDDDVKEYMNEIAEENGIADTDTSDDEVNDNVEGYYVDMSGNRLSGVPMVGDDDKDDVPENAYGIEAITYITAPTYFGGLFGFDGYPLQARAVSLLREVCSAGCVLPITTNEALMDLGGAEIGECFNIWRESQTGSITETMNPGLYGWVSWTWQEAVCGTPDRPCPEVSQGTNGCDAGVLADNLNPEYCASGFIKVGDWISSTSGRISADDVRCLLNYYVGYWDLGLSCSVTSTVPVPFTIPVYLTSTVDLSGGSSTPCLRMDPPTDPTSGGLHYKVSGFARMEMLGYQLSQGMSDEVNVGHDGVGCETIGEIPNHGTRITARFIRWVDDTLSTDECYDPAGTILSAPRLVE